MRIGMARVLRAAMYGFALTALLMALILPSVSAKDTTPQFRVRVLNAVPDSAGDDVVIDNVQVAGNVAFKTLTTYLSEPEGNYELSIYAAGKRTQSASYVFKRAFFFHSPKDYTIVIHGKQADNTVDATVEIDRNSLDGTNNAQVRFGDYLLNSGTLTLATGGSNTNLGSARFRETADYVDIAGGTYTLVVYDGNGGTVMKMDGIAFGPSTAVSVFALGIPGGTPAPVLIVNTDTGAAPVQPATTTTTTTTTVAPNPVLPAPAPAPAPATSSASAALRQALQPVPSIANTGTKVFFAATGHTLGGSFKAYWDSHGGLEQFGYPISEEYQEVSLTDGKTYTTQYFERARFEYHPENKGTQYEVLQGLLGKEMLKLLGAG